MGANLIKSDRNRKIRTIHGYVTNAAGTPAVSQGSGYTLTDNGVGDISIALSRPGRRFLSATVLPVETTAATGHFAKLIAAPTASGIRVGTYEADGTDGAPADCSFAFSITVSDVAL